MQNGNGMGSKSEQSDLLHVNPVQCKFRHFPLKQKINSSNLVFISSSCPPWNKHFTHSGDNHETRHRNIDVPCGMMVFGDACCDVAIEPLAKWNEQTDTLLFQISPKPEKKHLLISPLHQLYCTCASEESWKHSMLMAYKPYPGDMYFSKCWNHASKTHKSSNHLKSRFCFGSKNISGFAARKEAGNFTL